MDIGRSFFEVAHPRSRLDAGTHATMGLGLGYAIAAAVHCPNRRVIAVEGDSAFGFSGMEGETTRSVLFDRAHSMAVEAIARYRLPIMYVQIQL